MLAVLIFSGGSVAAGELIVRTITISWDVPAGDVAGYRVHYGTRSLEYSHEIDVGNQTTADIPNLVDGTTYFFAVTAYNSAGDESMPSDELVHTPNPGLFLNMSTRARVDSGDAVMISGFIIGGSSRKTVIIRANGPSLEAAGLTGTLADPTIELHGPDGLIDANDNWRDGSPEALYRVGFMPRYDSESALVTTLAPGNYTVILRGTNESSGIALLEVYDGGIPGVP